MNIKVVTMVSVAVVLAVAGAGFAANTPVAACKPAMPAVHEPQEAPLIRQAAYFDGGYNLAILSKRLGLSDQQMKDMKILFTSFEDRTKSPRSDLKSVVDKKREMLTSGKLDQQKLAEMDDQIAKLRSDLFRERQKLVRDRLSLLNSSQLQKLGHLKTGLICRVVKPGKKADKVAKSD